MLMTVGRCPANIPVIFASSADRCRNHQDKDFLSRKRATECFTSLYRTYIYKVSLRDSKAVHKSGKLRSFMQFFFQKCSLQNKKVLQIADVGMPNKKTKRIFVTFLYHLIILQGLTPNTYLRISHKTVAISGISLL